MSDILLSAFALSLVLLGILSFFGIEIIRRGIIFTDLAIGQLAAMGAAVSILFLDGRYLDILSLGFALAGGTIVAVAARRTDKHEAFIGLLYAFGFSGVFILLSQSCHGMEMFQKLMASDILFTPMSDLVKAAAVYLALGAVLLIFYPRLRGLAKEALFFVTFAVTVTIAVRLAGVLVVFALLVAPALIALRIRRGISIINAWIIGTCVNLLSILLSYNLDFPTGYTLVFSHAVFALAVALIAPAGKSPEHTEGISRAARSWDALCATVHLSQNASSIDLTKNHGRPYARRGYEEDRHSDLRSLQELRWREMFSCPA